MIKLDDHFYKYQALAALAAAANYNNYLTANMAKRVEHDFEEPKSKKLRTEEQYSDIESDEETDKKELEEEIDVGNEISDDEKFEKTTRKSSFFISDILGLDTPKPESKAPSLFDQLLQNYQQQLQRTFDIYRLFSASQTHDTSAREEKKEETSGSASILSSLEKLAKSQFNESPMTPSEILNSPQKTKKIDSATTTTTKKVEIQIKKEEENQKDSNENKTENKPDANLFPAWVYCTRYSDRPSAGPRHRKKKSKSSNQAKSSQKTGIFKKDANNNNNNNNVLKNISQSYQSSSSSSNSSFSLPSPSQINPFLSVLNGSKSKENENYENDNVDSDDEINEDYDDNESDTSHSKRPRTAFTSSQLQRLKHEFEKCKYLTGEKRQYLANELNLNESQIKIWFQNKRAKIKKSSGVKNSLALQLMAQGLYNHSNNPKLNQSIDSNNN